MKIPGELIFAMENHSSALLTWINYGVKDAVCIHLDAHLDVGWISQSVASYQQQNPSDISELRERDCFLHTKEGNFDISNWLSIALCSNMVQKLYWVIPDELWSNNPEILVKFLLSQVGQVQPESIAKLKLYNNIYKLLIYGKETLICKLSDLPVITESDTVLLDIDLDFFARYKYCDQSGNWGTSWIKPETVLDKLFNSFPNASITTISRSLHGGYLPYSLYEQLHPVFEVIPEINHEELWGRKDSLKEKSYSDYTYACGLLHRKSYDQAYTFAEQAVTINFEIPAYHYVLGLTANSIQKEDKALEEMSYAVSSGIIESAQVLNDYAALFNQINEIPTALEIQQKAFQLDLTESPVISSNLVSLYAKLKNWDSVYEFAQITVKRQPFNSFAYAMLATSLQIRGDTSAAVEAWNNAATMSFNSRTKQIYKNLVARHSKKSQVH